MHTMPLFIISFHIWAARLAVAITYVSAQKYIKECKVHKYSLCLVDGRTDLKLPGQTLIKHHCSKICLFLKLLRTYN